MGLDKLSDVLYKTGIKTEIKNVASTALGTSEINMIDYSNAFITLANEGNHENPHIIEKIEDNDGNLLYEYKYKNEYILNKKYVFIINNLLNSTYDYRLINYTSPTLLSISNLLDSKYSVKSGSTDTDYWTIGYNKDYLMLTWAGNDDNKKVKSSESKITKRIWAKTITSLPNNTKTWYDIPSGITIDTIDSITGEYKENGYICYYEKGSEPSFNNLELYNILNSSN